MLWQIPAQVKESKNNQQDETKSQGEGRKAPPRADDQHQHGRHHLGRERGGGFIGHGEHIVCGMKSRRKPQETETKRRDGSWLINKTPSSRYDSN
jgi:hypothetical protein